MKKKIRFIFTIVITALVLSIGIGVIAKQSTNEKNQIFFDIAKKSKKDKTVVAIVDNEKIYQYQIDIQIAAQELSQKNAVEAGADISLMTIQTEEEVLKYLIRNTVILQEAKKQKLTAKYSDAKKQQEEQFDIIMDADNEQTKFIEQYREEMGWTEKEHIKQAAIEWQNTLTKANLKNKFFEENIDSTEEDYEKYIDTLVENANIEYK